MSDSHSSRAAAPQRFDVSDLRPEQMALLNTVLSSGEVPHAIDQQQLVVTAPHVTEVARALAWVRAGALAEDFDDPEYRSDRPPVVKPSRPPLADGRREATRWRRFGGGLVDQALLLTPAWLATRAGAPLWATVPVLLVVFVLPLGAFGWSIGKLVVGSRVVSQRTLRSPGPVLAMARWALSASPFLLAMTVGWSDAALTPIWLAIHAPIVLALRGAHDHLAGTVVVEAKPVVVLRRGK
ncbi:MAG: RDD family protein [Ilumatobacteraceae bacterium]